MTEEMGLQMFPENRKRCRRDVQRQSVSQSGSSDRKSSIADGWNAGAWDNKRWCRCRAETLTTFVSRWLMEYSAMYGGAVWCGHLCTRTASLNLMRSDTFSQCNCQEWRDAVVPRCGKHKPSSRIQVSTPSASAWWDAMECQPALHYHSSTAAERGTKPVTEERSAELSD